MKKQFNPVAATIIISLAALAVGLLQLIAQLYPEQLKQKIENMDKIIAFAPLIYVSFVLMIAHQSNRRIKKLVEYIELLDKDNSQMFELFDKRMERNGIAANLSEHEIELHQRNADDREERSREVKNFLGIKQSDKK